MTDLTLDPQEAIGALAIADWIDATIAAEGVDRPQFKAIASYISSDIRDAVAAMPDKTADWSE